MQIKAKFGNSGALHRKKKHKKKGDTVASPIIS